ncbi:MAG: DUF416 family protein [Bacteroidia bacterium]
MDSISTFATDSVDMYIQEIQDLDMNLPGSEEKIAFHPLMIREKKCQKYILDYLNDIKLVHEEDINKLEELQNNNGMGNLDL